jgi:predicted regulator of Ras-like GTPase activity (Roadblock/LC7/MglB family)
MGAFPTLYEEDFQYFDLVLTDLIKKSEAHIALIVEQAGYLVHQCGSGGVDTTTLATLGSNAFNATQFMASLVNEQNFTSMYQQGEHYSTLILNIEENTLLVLVFGTQQTVGSMTYYAAPAVRMLAEQIDRAQRRNPGSHLDLSDLNPEDMSQVFKRG